MNRRIGIVSIIYALTGFAIVASAQSVSFVLVPDQQNFFKTPGMVQLMCTTIMDNRTTWNIQAVVSLGDFTNYATPTEFQSVVPCWNSMNAAGLITVPILGNHDYDGGNYPVGRQTTAFDSYFGPAYFTGKTFYQPGTSFPAGSNANYYVRWTVGT